MEQSMDSYSVLYHSPFLFRDQTVLTVYGETLISHFLEKRKKKQEIVTPLSLRKRCANVKNRSVFHCCCKQTSKGRKKGLSKETQKKIIPCLHQATVQASDRVWKRCGMTPLSCCSWQWECSNLFTIHSPCQGCCKFAIRMWLAISHWYICHGTYIYIKFTSFLLTEVIQKFFLVVQPVFFLFAISL